MQTIGVEKKIKPMLILARDRAGQPVALFPFGVSKIGGLRVAQFLGGRDSNTNIPLFRPGASFSQPDLRGILTRAAKASGYKADAFMLANQPVVWAHEPNPMHVLSHQLSPSYLHTGALSNESQSGAAGAETSAKRKKKMRWRIKKLGAQGEVKFLKAEDRRLGERVLQAHITQKEARFAAMGFHGCDFTPFQRSFLERACLEGIEAGQQSIEIFALMVGDRVAATWLGCARKGRYYAMMTSFDSDPAMADLSPGDLLLAHVVANCVERGLAEFDLGVGESKYKDTWCDRAEPLFDTLLGVTVAGHIYCVVEGWRRRIKRMIKQSDWLWPMAVKLRKFLSARRQRRALTSRNAA